MVRRNLVKHRFSIALAKIGFIEAANSQLFFQVWNCLGLLLDLEQIVQKQRIDRIEFVTDSAARALASGGQSLFGSAWIAVPHDCYRGCG